MVFLSLSKADPAAKQLLQRAIRARYGYRPVNVESLRMTLERVSRGPLGLPVKLLTEVAYVGAYHWRWQQSRRLQPIGFPLGRTIESFDGGAYYTAVGGRVIANNDPRVLESYRRRIWAVQTLLLTPLNEDSVILKSRGEGVLQATPDAYPDDVATLYLNENDTVAAVEVERFRPEDGQTLLYRIRLGSSLKTWNDVVLPAQFTYQWADEPGDPYIVTAAQPNVMIPLTEFTMQPS